MDVTTDETGLERSAIQRRTLRQESYFVTSGLSAPVGYDYTKDVVADPSGPVKYAEPVKASRAAVDKNNLELGKRLAIRRELAGAVGTATEMQHAQESDELRDLSIAGFRLRDQLSDLWKLRDVREPEWGDLLNLLQISLALEEFERFSAIQCEAVHRVLRDYLAAGIVDYDDIEDCTALLRRAGLNPWKGLTRA